MKLISISGASIFENMEDAEETPQQVAARFLKKLRDDDAASRQKTGSRYSNIIGKFCQHVITRVKRMDDFDRQVIKIICNDLKLTPIFPPALMKYDEISNVLRKLHQGHKLSAVGYKLVDPSVYVYEPLGCFILNGNECMVTPEFNAVRPVT